MSTRKALALSFLDRYSGLVLHTVSSMVVARLLTPGEIGVYSVTMVLLGFVATFGGWAMYARLDSAVTTQGVLLAESQKKTVNHLEGGILDKLLVQAGDRVTEGQVVALLDATQVRAQLAQLESQRKASSFDIWRLEAEEANAAALDPATAPEPDTAQIAAIETADLRALGTAQIASAPAITNKAIAPKEIAGAVFSPPIAPISRREERAWRAIMEAPGVILVQRENRKPIRRR